MLPYALAIVVGLSSSILFVSAFLFKDLHRQDDFLWSGVGLFYALTLWYCSNNIRGSMLLGQLAAVCLISAYFWQVWNLRTAIAKPEQNISKEEFSVVAFAKNLFRGKSSNKNSQSSKIKQPKNQTPTKSNKSTATEADKANIYTDTRVVSTKNIAPPQTPSSIFKPKSQSVNPNSSDQTSPKPSSTNTEVTIEKTQNNSKEETPAVEKDNTIKAPAENPASNPSATITEKPNNAEQDQANSIVTIQPIQEIQAEEITVIEEESNWEDDVEDIDPDSVTVIEVEAEQSETSE